MHPFRTGLLIALGLLSTCDTHADDALRIAGGSSYVVANGIALLRQAYRRLGLRIEAVEVPAERGLRMSNEGSLDGEALRVEGLEQQYPNLIRIPVAVLATSVEAIAIDPSVRVSSWDDLRTYSLCIPHGIKAIELPTAGMKTYAVNSVQQIIKMLQANHCQIGVIASATWADYEALDWAGIRSAGRLGDFALYHYLNKRHAALVPRVTVVLEHMRAEGIIPKAQRATDEVADAARTRALRRAGASPAKPQRPNTGWPVTKEHSPNTG